ncbi:MULTISPECIES: helix-hairpin-helix domain-containing protein [unclassified Halomonas]|uniref:helix-hairpin-helix domain-containing protein n=1 Tax=unclassified Halomonas TaxID=2609666 RepID=UPI0006D94505|nr:MULTISPECIES: helix-hairpin-helix domain-containing protein [unclassified Halomonas]KPQ22061.1 MAG: hypothetical protein HLUCCO06_02220 [Halomonas sp. HL-93]SBR48560.1 hypothetical protein GA0071314_1748 [Halomonas sp. HL-93]SNY96227.1 hypothetical protein SAMN04488142_0761 [Halomonas sp. hl-4]
MTDSPQHLDGCLEAVQTLYKTVEQLLYEPATEARLITAMTHCHKVHQTLMADTPSAATRAALARTEQFIIASAEDYYRQLPDSSKTTLNGNERTKLFGNRLMALDGIGPATAMQLMERGIFTPEQLFDLSFNALKALDLPPASHARVASLHSTQHVKTPD